MKSFHITIAFIILTQLSFAQSKTINMEVLDDRNNLILLGKSTRERLQQEPFASWFNANYAGYIIDSTTANNLKPLVKGKHFVIFMGTWCGDSRREVPRMYKLLDYCGVDPSQIELVNVSNHDTAYKQSPGHEERGLNIHRVPDLLVYTGKKETGRIVESPVESLEKDLLAILSGKPYEPNYKAVSSLYEQLQKTSVKKLTNKQQEVADGLKPLAKHRAELLSYGYIHLALKEYEKAILIFQLNTLLFPADAEVWNGLATGYIRKGDTTAALEQYRKAIALQPANETAVKMMQQLSKNK